MSKEQQSKYKITWEPLLIVDNTPLNGNNIDIDNLFNNICNGFQKTKNYCRLTVSKDEWILDNKIWNKKTMQFESTIKNGSTFKTFMIVLTVILLSKLILLLGYYCWYKKIIQKIIKEQVQHRINEH